MPHFHARGTEFLLPLVRSNGDARSGIGMVANEDSGYFFYLDVSSVVNASLDMKGRLYAKRLKADILNTGLTTTALSGLITKSTTIVTATLAPITLTMLAAADLEAGDMFIIKDGSNACSTNNITIARPVGATYTFGTAGASLVMNTNGQVVWLLFDGTNFQVI